MNNFCETCENTGIIRWYETVYVSREMAIDGGDAQLEGMPMQTPCAAPCPYCNGENK